MRPPGDPSPGGLVRYLTRREAAKLGQDAVDHATTIKLKVERRATD